METCMSVMEINRKMRNLIQFSGDVTEVLGKCKLGLLIHCCVKRISFFSFVLFLLLFIFFLIKCQMNFTLDLNGVNTVEFKYFCQSFSLQLILYIYVNIYFTLLTILSIIRKKILHSL